jgi:hypothetical protein
VIGYHPRQLVWLVVFNASFNNISAILWRLVLLVEETGVPSEKYRPVVTTTIGMPQIKMNPQYIFIYFYKISKIFFE